MTRKERMKEELDEVREFLKKTSNRLNKLTSFVHSNKFTQLNDQAKTKLIIQATNMSHIIDLLADYHMVLNDRIEDVGDDDE